jgi:NitT/TauT family transport system permease protein
VERCFLPYVLLSQTVPILAMVPLIGFWIGFDFTSRVIIVVIVSVFPIVTNTLFGLRSVEPILQDLFTMHRAGRAVRLAKLQFPAALPAMFTGFRIASGMAVLGAIIADFFFRRGEPGIGRLIDVYRARLQTEQLFTAIAFASLLGIIVFSGFGWLGHRLTRAWHASEQDRI